MIKRKWRKAARLAWCSHCSITHLMYQGPHLTQR